MAVGNIRFCCYPRLSWVESHLKASEEGVATRLGVKKSAVASVLAMRTAVVPGPKDSWQIITCEALPGNVLKASITTCASIEKLCPSDCSGAWTNAEDRVALDVRWAAASHLH